jgi:tRNA(Ile)-lysidine synthase
LARTDVSRAADGAALSVKILRALAPDRRRNALRFWIARAGLAVPDTKRLEQLAGPIIDARPDAHPFVSWNGSVIRREADLLFLRAAVPGATNSADREGGTRAPIPWSWRESPQIDLPWGLGKLELRPDPRGPIDLDAIPELVTIGWRAGGERLRPRRGGPRKELKGLLQEAHVSLAERAKLPLIFSGPELLAVGVMWLDASIQARAGPARRGRLVWDRS